MGAEMPLHEVFRAVRAVCLEGEPLEQAFGAAAALPTVGRMEIYRRFVGIHLFNILGHVYPRASRDVGAERFGALRRAFYQVHPPTSWDQNRNAEPFPAWLREHGAAALPDLPPYLADLADYEWWDFAVSVSTEIIPERVDEPALNPTLALRSYQWDVAAWLHDGAAGPGSGTPPARRDHPLAFYRHRTEDRAYVLPATPRVLAVLKMIYERVPVDRVVAESGIPRAALEEEIASLAAQGVVLLPDAHSPR